MTWLDWAIVALYMAGSVAIGVFYRRHASKNIEEYFIKGRNLSWWLVGVSAVATYTDAGLAPAVTMWVYQRWFTRERRVVDTLRGLDATCSGALVKVLAAPEDDHDS